MRFAQSTRRRARQERSPTHSNGIAQQTTRTGRRRGGHTISARTANADSRSPFACTDCQEDAYSGDDELDLAKVVGGSISAAIIGADVRLLPTDGSPAAGNIPRTTFPRSPHAASSSAWSSQAALRSPAGLHGRRVAALPRGQRCRRAGVSLSASEGHALGRTLARERAVARRRSSLFHGGAEEEETQRDVVAAKRARGESVRAQARKEHVAHHAALRQQLPAGPHDQWSQPPERWRELLFQRSRLAKALAVAAGVLTWRMVVMAPGSSQLRRQSEGAATAAAKEHGQHQQEEACGACVVLCAGCAALCNRVKEEARAAIRRLTEDLAHDTVRALSAAAARLGGELKRGIYEMKVLVEQCKVFVPKLELVLEQGSTAAPLSLRSALQSVSAALLDAWAVAHSAVSGLEEVRDELELLRF